MAETRITDLPVASTPDGTEVVPIVQGAATVQTPLTQVVRSTPASEVATGVVEMATTAEATAGTDTARAVTPAGVAANVAAYVAALTWTTYTPTLTASVTNPTLGSGSSVSGRYIRIGNLVIARVMVIAGTSGTAVGSGDYRLSLPVATTADFAVCGHGMYFDSGTSQLGTTARLDGNDYVVMFRHAATTLIGSASPGLAANDQIWLTLNYPVV